MKFYEFVLVYLYYMECIILIKKVKVAPKTNTFELKIITMIFQSIMIKILYQ